MTKPTQPRTCPLCGDPLLIWDDGSGVFYLTHELGGYECLTRQAKTDLIARENREKGKTTYDPRCAS